MVPITLEVREVYQPTVKGTIQKNSQVQIFEKEEKTNYNGVSNTSHEEDQKYAN